MKAKQGGKVEIPFSSHRMLLENFKIGGKYLIFEPIGRGSHSVVYYGAQENSMEERAIKFYNFREIEEFEGFRNKQICKRISKYELLMMKECKSINILQPLNVYEDKDHKVIVFEYCQSSLASEIEARSNKQISQIKAVFILKQIINALKTLHRRNRIHTRLQPKDILVKNGIYKLVDLGLPRLEAEDGFPYYSPEILGKKYYDEKAQVWIIGILFHQILFGEPPDFYRDNSPRALLQYSSRCIFQEYGSEVSRQVVSFLSGCLTVSPEERMSWEQLYNHELLGNMELTRSRGHNLRREEKGMSGDNRMSLILPLEEQQEEQQVKVCSQRFNMDEEKLTLQKQIQKDYHKVGQPFELQPLERISIQHLKDKINHDQKKLYILMTQYYLQCQKVEFVYYYIIRPFLNKNSKYTRPVIELLNLMASSCFSAMSFLRFKNKDKKSYEGLLQSCVFKETTRLYEVVKNTWQLLGQALFKEQSRLLSILSDKASRLLNQEQFNKKDIFLSGIEGKDFQPEAKFKFTEQFAKDIKPDLEKLILAAKQKYPQDLAKLRRALDYLDAYTKIWAITTEHKVQDSYPSLQQYIDTRILAPL